MKEENDKTEFVRIFTINYLIGILINSQGQIISMLWNERIKLPRDIREFPVRRRMNERRFMFHVSELWAQYSVSTRAWPLLAWLTFLLSKEILLLLVILLRTTISQYHILDTRYVQPANQNTQWKSMKTFISMRYLKDDFIFGILTVLRFSLLVSDTNPCFEVNVKVIPLLVSLWQMAKYHILTRKTKKKVELNFLTIFYSLLELSMSNVEGWSG